MAAATQAGGALGRLSVWAVDPAHGRQTAPLLVAVDALLTLATVRAVPHFDIDFGSYMAQAAAVGGGERNYSRVVGATGPLTYPAGHALLYTAIHSAALADTLVQLLAAAVHIANLALVLRLLLRTEVVPPYMLVLLSVGATRTRSLAVIHLFNDPLAILLLHAALNMFLDRRWTLGSLLFSLGVSVKMNILLFAPALLATYLTHLSLPSTLLQLSLCAGVQVFLAAPFLLADPLAYIKGAFNVGRLFLHRDSVNWAFLPRALFLSRGFHLLLTCLHLLALTSTLYYCWTHLAAAAEHSAAEEDVTNNTTVTSHKPARSRWTFRWRTQAVLAAVAALVPAILSLPHFHPLLVHALLWPSLALLLAFPAITVANLANFQMVEPHHQERRVSAEARRTNAILLPFFLCNFIGVVCARSVHVQFYSWYFYSLHYLLCHTTFTTNFKLLLLSNIELAYFSLEFNTVLSYLAQFGTNQLENFESWVWSACRTHLSAARDGAGFEVELPEEAPAHCRRGTGASSLALQAAHWALLLHLLGVLGRRGPTPGLGDRIRQAAKEIRLYLNL